MLLAAAQGGEAAGTVDAFNRQLHISEKWQIQQLAKNDPKKQARLLIASCALTKCSAEFAIGSPEYVEAKKIEDMGNSAVFKAERDLLSVQIGVRGKLLFTYDSESLLGSDADVDALKRWNNTYGVTTRIGGGLQVVGGTATGVASSGLAAAGAAACPETLGAACAAALLGAGGVVWSADQVSSGLTTVWTGRATPTLGGKLVSNIFDVSSGTGELINGVLGLSPLAVDAALAKGIIKIPVAVSKTDASVGTVGANIISESAINPALASRLDPYKAWKADNGVVGAPSLKEFQLFDDPSRVPSGFKTYANKEWPPNSGALDGNSPFTLLPGAKVDRFGSDFGSYLSPTGTNYVERALRPGTQNSPYSVFEVTGRLDVEVATIRPWFGEIGMGTQFKLLGDTRVKTLLESGQLKEIYRGTYNGYKH